MTLKSIEEQIAVIEDAAAKANVSRESAIAFLTRAGIISPEEIAMATAGHLNEEASAALSDKKSKAR